VTFVMLLGLAEFEYPNRNDCGQRKADCTFEQVHKLATIAGEQVRPCCDERTSSTVVRSRSSVRLKDDRECV
jgi:hypothetical protein